MTDEKTDLTLVVIATGAVLVLDDPDGLFDFRLLSLSQFSCLTSEPGVYRVEGRMIAGRFIVSEYEEYKLVRSGEVVTIPTPAE